MNDDIVIFTDDPEADRDIYAFTAEESDSEIRLDVFLSQKTGFSRTRVAELCESGYVLVNSIPRKKNFRLTSGDELELSAPPPTGIEAKPQNIPLDIYYEDENLLVVNKPQGMVVHPAPGNPDGTLVNALLFHCDGDLSGINGKLRPGIVHRIDKDTAGLLIVAKNELAHISLAAQIKAHTFSRKYRAILYGVPEPLTGTIRTGIGRSRTDRKKMAAFPIGTPGTKEAVTHYRVLRAYGAFSYVELTLETGRTHQIRVHMREIGHPVLADPVYAAGRKTLGLYGQALVAFHIGFIHPVTGERLVFECPDPDFINKALEIIEHEI